MTTSLAPLHTVAALLGCLTAASAQDRATPATDANRKAVARAAAVGLQLVHEWRWGEDGAPSLQEVANIGPLLARMAVSADGGTVAAESASRVLLFAADGSSRTAVATPMTLAGPGADAGFLAGNHGNLWRLGMGDQEQELKVEAPDRTDLFASPFGERMLVSGLAGRGIRTALVPLDGGAPIVLKPPEPIASAAAVAWSNDGRQLAVAWAVFTSASRKGLDIEVFGVDGRSVQKIATAGVLPRALDFSYDGRTLCWVGAQAIRTDVASGRQLASAEATALLWCNLDPGVALSVDPKGISLWSADALLLGRRVDVALEPRTFGKRVVGPVLAAAVGKKRTALAVATVRGLLLYHIEL